MDSLNKMATVLVTMLTLSIPARPQGWLADLRLSARATFSAESREVTVELTNLGEQEITAFGLTLSTIGVDLDRSHHETVDLLPLLSLRMPGVRITGSAKEPSFRPGETYSINWRVPDNWGALSTASIVVRPTMVLYNDCTVWGDNQDASTVFRRRASDAAAMQRAMDDTKAITREGRQMHSAVGLKLLQSQYEAAARVRGPQTDQWTYQAELVKRFATEVERHGWGRLDLIIPVYERRAELLRAHAVRKEK